MKTPVYVILCVAILIALGVARHTLQSQRAIASQQMAPITAPIEPANQKLPPMLPPPAPPQPRVAQAPPTNAPASKPARKTASQKQTPPASGGKEIRQDPIARAALSLVGMDPAAEEYWAIAINDPTLSDKEREDLIEDLNEEGFDDPANPTLEELPLIVNRLQIIEHYAPFAMDENNARSFAEAYKDLANMFLRLTVAQ
jgi:hypothetical protein